MVAAAQNATHHQAEIAIRPELDSEHKEVLADHLYITLADASQKATLMQALGDVAQRHGLERSAVSPSNAFVRLDYSLLGRRTQAIDIITPVAANPGNRSRTSNGPMLAIILDDLGYDRASADALLALPFPLTVSILPHLPYSTEIAEQAYRRGDEVMLHLPMASAGNGTRPEAIELSPEMSQQGVTLALAAMLDTVPHASGVNNHQGSLATADARLMNELMPELRRRGLFFIDSRTTTQTLAYDAAERAGVHAAFRNVFLDDTPSREAAVEQLELAARDAQKNGWAIAIGHPHPGTLSALEEDLPRLQARGIRLVFASELAR